ncbi:MAG: TonB-dependent receptor [Chitinophagales bacterium]|nr:TonB-dependent receptor [Chitinophagales bacterium]MDW8419242.1 TonB-dependent receptor [Chitinophagales bacterium]
MKFCSWWFCLLLTLPALAQKTENQLIDTTGTRNAKVRDVEEVVISATLSERTRLQSPIPVESYSANFLKRSRPVNLFEGLHQINGVLPQINCNVCNTGDIHINGMEGPYTMVLIDGMPLVSSLASVYGLMGIPNSMVRRIEVTKGPASILYGSEAMGGVINVITRSGKEAQRFTAEVQGTTLGEFQADVSTRIRVRHSQALLGINYSNYLIPSDVNRDNFTDVTLQHRLSIFHKWNFFRPGGKAFTLAARYVWEDRWGGQLQWKKIYAGSDSIYGETALTHRAELFGTYQILNGKADMFADYSFVYHYQNSYYGTIHLRAGQITGFAQLRLMKQWGAQQVLMGLPLRIHQYDDNTWATEKLQGGATTNSPQFNLLPGIFIQDEITVNERFTVLAGMRYDYHTVHGNIITPRLAVRINPAPDHVTRVTLGTGYRVVNVFTEEHTALTGARKVVLEEKLKPERTWNMTLQHTATFYPSSGNVSLDGSIFYTHFTNRIVPDYESNPAEIQYGNLNGYSISAGASLNIEARLLNNLNIIAGATYSENYIYENNIYGGFTRTPVMHAPRLSFTGNAGYRFGKTGWQMDVTARINGPMYLPVLPNDFRPPKSPWYALVNVQASKSIKQRAEIYLAAKNILNFIPKHPIMRPHDPFDRYTHIDNPHGYRFDTSYNYAPVQGIKLIGGIRVNIS